MNKKLIPALLTAILTGMTVNAAYAADTNDVDSVTMDVMENSNPHEITNNIQLPAQASPTADDHVTGTDDSHDNTSEDTQDSNEAKDDAKDDAMDDAKDDAADSAEQEANDAMQDSNDTMDSTK